MTLAEVRRAMDDYSYRYSPRYSSRTLAVSRASSTRLREMMICQKQRSKENADNYTKCL